MPEPLPPLPISTFAPVLNRELLIFLRRPRAFLLLAAYLGLLFIYSFGVWSSVPGGRLGAYASQISRALFLFYSYVQIILCAICAIVLSSRQISSERRQRTFDLLLTTPLRISEILVNKALASIGYVLLLVIAATPFYSTSLLLGGVGWTEVILTTYLTLLTLVTYAMIGVGASALPLRGAKSDQGSGLWILFALNGGVAVIIWGLLAYGLETPRQAKRIGEDLFILLSPVGAFSALTDSDFLWMRGAIRPKWAILAGHSLVQAILFLVFLRIGLRSIRKEDVAIVPQAGARPKARHARRWRLELPHLFPLRDEANPVAAKDILLVLPKTTGGRLAIALLIVSVFGIGVWAIVDIRRWMNSALAVGGIGVATTGYDVASCIGVGLAMILALLRASGVVAAEYEADTAPLLAATPLRERHIMRGKLVAVLVTVVALIVLLDVLLTAVFCVLYPRAIRHALLILPLSLIGMVGGSALTGAIGLCISAGAPTVRAAGNRALALVLTAAFFGVPVVTAALFGLLEPSAHARLTAPEYVLLLVLGLGALAIALAITGACLEMAADQFRYRTRGGPDPVPDPYAAARDRPSLFPEETAPDLQGLRQALGANRPTDRSGGTGETGDQYIIRKL